MADALGFPSEDLARINHTEDGDVDEIIQLATQVSVSPTLRSARRYLLPARPRVSGAHILVHSVLAFCPHPRPCRNAGLSWCGGAMRPPGFCRNYGSVSALSSPRAEPS
jgi:hypothetical protein